ncbi:Asp-tRNA(Asn)/Glu-tRNA(Gln) amidotransferase subunit GatB [Aurantibacillus circumpalustris]|uniref:Asp-tRNA(Asn)/Glu-tRNA(Gln) amidotransferase subunit GatB n=1 Tax=Aurantibacillus circumpalustris TaxID=3036359 RepID=UPI00295AE8F9|nr:Asp-tRNA(Asn)/Glu-tRNA(Gln) amidotransferase subunit GatB [Aurantibacillus circumpalustris]
MSVYDKYEPVIGLECHIQLLTKTKMYSNDIAEYGGLPNSHVSVVTLGHPGTLPVVNERAIEFAVKLGIAVNSDIREENQFARKNYFYADLPKGYQITQDKTPICTGGYVSYKLDGVEKKVNLTRIHMEEDAGKSLHDIDPFETLIDLNRAGTPLLEIVSEPEIKSGEEAYAYMTEVRKLVRYLGICDGNMEEGSLRCDANISVMKKGSKTFGKKVEVKNMNSFRNVQRAIDFEIKRQIDLLEEGGEISGETRSFDAVNDLTFSLRSKENANDYRYFPEPDLQPVYITQEYINKIKAVLPTLPAELFKTYTEKYKLSEYDALQIIESKEVAMYFNELVKHTSNYKGGANWIIGPIRSYLNERALNFSEFTLSPEKIAEIIQLIDSGKVSNSVASQTIFPALIENPSATAEEIAKQKDLIQNSDSNELQGLIDTALSKFPEKIAEYKNGKVGLLGMFVGEVMKLSKGKADPKLLNQLVKETLEK